jgi:hypothetical protein
MTNQEAFEVHAAAIELLRAAVPKDEAAEREHCLQVAAEIEEYRHTDAQIVLMRERAAVRAPLQAEIERLNRAYKNADNDYVRECEERDALATKLLEAQAEIERLKAEVASRIDWADRANRAEAKLSNLRAATEAHLKRNPRGDQEWLLVRAIEASK